MSWMGRQSIPGLIHYTKTVVTSWVNMFNNNFIVVRDKVNPEPILGILGAGREYTTDGTPVHRRLNTLW